MPTKTRKLVYPPFRRLLAGCLTLCASAAGPSLHALTGQSFEEARDHWAFQPIRRPPFPRVIRPELIQSPVDSFLLARLESAGLTFAPRADPRTLLRRVSYDLIGLPPTFEQVQAFESDPSPAAYAAIVDQLLGDPRYGERWGRHWLDVARYADTKDLVLLYGTDAIRPYAYTYRDYVIRALNEDLPYDEFVRDQLAADLVQPALPPWRLAALGFLTLGRLFDGNVHDQIDDQIDTVSRGFLAMTVACARCHDHKYDAIKSADYYGLYGVFASTERPELPPLIEDPQTVPGGADFEKRLQGAVQTLENHVDDQYRKLTETLRSRVGDYLLRAATTQPDITETSQFALSLTPEDYRPALMLRARRLLEQRLRHEDRIFGLWADLIALPDHDFAEHASLLVSNELAAPRGPASPRNALVAAWFSESPMQSRADVPRSFAGLLRERNRILNSRTCGDDAYIMSGDEADLAALIRGPQSPVWFPRRDTSDHMSRPDKDRYNSLVLDLDKIAAHAKKPPPARAMVVRDLPEPVEPHLFIRGNPSRLGPAVPRAFLRVLTGGEARALGPGSGRLELARAIIDPANPLTARVIVNRIWMEHFGEPLVASTADFGVRSEPPTHPALLDWMAAELMDSGWRLKSLHRCIVLSAAYQQGTPDFASSGADLGPSTTNSAPGVDPSNRLLWHYPRRRLDLEAMRDSLLFASGRLDSTIGGRPVDVARDPLNCRRTVYGLVDRQNLPPLFRAFDFAVPDQCIERRPQTTVPQQALFAMNSPFVLEQARALAGRPEVREASAPRDRVDALFELVLARRPADSETRMALDFVGAAARQNDGAKLDPWQQLAQVLLVSNEAVFLD